MRSIAFAFVTVAAWALVALTTARAADWPTHRADAARSGYTAEQLPSDLELRWIYRSQPAQPAWPSSARKDFDRADSVVVAGDLLVIGSSGDGAIRGLDAKSGVERWSFFTDAPVRVAPTIWGGRVFAVSDDGCLYCLDSKDGGLRWKKRGGPSERMVLGNDRLCSAWPSRGGPAIVDGVLYWAAGVWPSDGIYVYALDAESGEEMWKNDTDGQRFMAQPHGGADAHSGLSAQGHIVVEGDRVLLPTGRAVPAALQRNDGKFGYFHLQKYGHVGGSSIVSFGDYFHNGGQLYETSSGLAKTKLPGRVARFGDRLVATTPTGVSVREWKDEKKVDRKGKPVEARTLRTVMTLPLDGAKLEIIGAGSSVVVGSEGRVVRLDTKSGKVDWSAKVTGNAHRLAVASGRLYVSTDDGLLYCFAPRGDEALEPRHTARPRALPPHDVRWADHADEILTKSGVREGYCVVLGDGDGGLAIELARQSRLFVYCVTDAANLAPTRAKIDASGLYGARIAIHARPIDRTGYPTHFANLVVCSATHPQKGPKPLADEIQRLTRPWGGVTAIGPPGELAVHKRGPLESAGSWTHQYSNPANTCCSTDSLVKGPLRMRWFRDADLPMPQRHGRAPAPLFHRGFLIVEGIDGVRASDAYNGRTLWEYALPGILKPYDQDHLTGTAGTGSNLCVEGDRVFVHRKTHCIVLDLETGEKLLEIPTPKRPDGKDGIWGYLAAVDGILFGTVADPDHIVKWGWKKGDMSSLLSESFSLFAMDPDSGKILWSYRATHSIRHNAIAIGGGEVYLIDRELADVDRLNPRRGKTTEKKEAKHADGELLALNARTGEVVWRKKQEVFGTMLALSTEENALLMSYQPTRFRLPSEKGGRMAVFHTSDGYRLWDKQVKYESRPLINGSTIYAQGGAWELRTGTERPFPFRRSYGCGILAGGKNLMVFRSATMGYWDLNENKTTKSYGGVRPGCWINAIPAGGMVLVPDGSAGCKCSYLNRASLALESAE